MKKNYRKDPSKIFKLSPLQYKITQNDGTETSFQNEYWDNKKPGIYVDIVSGEPLFSSLAKYDSGTGWPSFYETLVSENVIEKKEGKFLSRGTEARSKYGDSHLGHVYPDGPKPTGRRYCINSASLKFIAASDLEKEGYGEYSHLFKDENDSPEDYIILAGGCFWGIEDLFKSFDGVTDTQVGYTGGDLDSPSYHDVKTGKTGKTGHAESIKIIFDKRKTSLVEILRYFFKIHDPTTKDRQGNDHGSQYRSAIFYRNDEQKKVAAKIIDEVNQLGRFRDPIVTTLESETEFFAAEEYHQDYLKKNPGGYTCHFVRD